ncbi:MAG: hypothetical protein GF350_05665 [Chitinivibrionales bacterium]|nr:hypothetical protein [Chitinivibrionales bacterium]
MDTQRKVPALTGKIRISVSIAFLAAASSAWAQNNPPVADAGLPVVCDERDQAMLDGSQSIDPDGTIETYEWTQIAGLPVSFDPAAMQPTFAAPWFLEDTDLFFRLVVFDNQAASDTDTVMVTVRASPDFDDYLDLSFSDGGTTIPYRLFIPRYYDPAEEFPLLVYLHGAGARGSNNTSQLSQTGGMKFVQPQVQAAYPHFIIAPQCPSNSFWSNLCNPWPDPIEGDTAAPCGQWYAGASHWQVDTTVPMKIVMMIKDSVMNHFSIDTDRIYGAGRSMGGFGTWDLITRQHDEFIAAIPVAGGGDPSRTPFITDIAVWAFHGDNDGTVDVRGSRNMISGIFNAGGWPEYTEIPVGSHSDACNGAWDEPGLYDWLFSHYKGDDTPPSAPAALTVTPAGLTGFDLSWSAAEDPQSGIHAYDIFRNGIRIASTENLLYHDNNLDFETEYTYEVRAVNRSLVPGPLSGPVTRTTGNYDGIAFQQSSGPQGIVSFEVEHYYEKGPGSGHSWEPDATAGSSGGSAMKAFPDNGTRINTGYASSSPFINYIIDFVYTGTHYIWTRGLGDSDINGQSDSYHAGLDGLETASSDRITHFNSSWTWSRSTMDTPPASFFVPSTGTHTFNAWMREDGTIIDKIVLTIDETYTPTGSGPPESERVTSEPAPGAISVQDLAPDADVYMHATSAWPGEYTRTGSGTIDNLAPGNYLLSIIRAGCRPEFRPAVVTGGSTTILQIETHTTVPLMALKPDTAVADGNVIDTAAFICAVYDDIDLDADIDLVCGFPDGTVRIYAHDGTGLQFDRAISAGTADMHCIRIADWNYDNFPDIITGHANGELNIFENNGDGSFAAASLLFAAGEGLTGFDIFDYERDHDPDFVIGYAGGDLQKAVYNGTSWSLSHVEQEGGGSIAVSDSAAPCMIDFSGDGIPDLISGTGTGTIVWFEGKDNGAFAGRGVMNIYGDTAALSKRSAVAALYGAPGGFKSIVISGSEGSIYTVPLNMRSDFVDNQSAVVDVEDLALFGDAYGTDETAPGWDPRCNLDLTEENNRQSVNAVDFSVFGDCWGNMK